ncbi:unannotated protein [freshwater metagenome]|uniref:Unannotated protein n=1 Tax=freshwater metagenome TaxID=449393 RepID=A0A6J7DKC1_9ZZZZ
MAVKLALGSVMDSPREGRGACPAVSVDSAKVDPCAVRVHAVPDGKYAFAPLLICGRIRLWKRLSLHPLWDRQAGDLAERRCKIDQTNWCLHYRRHCPRVLCRTPDHWKAHKGINVIRTFEQQAVITLELAVIGSEDDISRVGPATRFDECHDAAECLINKHVLHMDTGIDLKNLLRGQSGRDPIARRLIIGYKSSVVPASPVNRFRIENRLALCTILWVARRKIKVTPVDAPNL